MSEKIDTPASSDPAWREALDWLMREQAAPHDAGLRRQRDRWLNQNEAHAAAYRKAQRVWQLTGDVPPTFPVPTRRPVTSRRRPLMVGLAMAACIALLLAPDIRRNLWSDFHTGTAESREVALTDGSTVSLGVETAINAAFSADRRAVTLLSGQAFFQVTPDSTRPFTVDSDGVRVMVTGTAFDVRAAENEVVVEVKSGSVTVGRTQNGTQKPVVLKTGERARLSRGTDLVTTEEISPAQVGLWRTGRMVVNGATIAEVVEELQRHYRGFIVLRDETLAARRVTGVIDLTDPQAALNAVIQPHGGIVRQLTPFVLMASLL